MGVGWGGVGALKLPFHTLVVYRVLHQASLQWPGLRSQREGMWVLGDFPSPPECH